MSDPGAENVPDTAKLSGPSSSPATAISREDLELQKLKAETAKLLAEAKSAKQSSWQTPGTFLAVATVFVTLATTIPQCQINEVKKEQIALDIRELSARRDSLQVSRDSLIAQQQAIVLAIEGLNAEIGTIDSVRQATKRDLLLAQSSLEEVRLQLSMIPSSAGKERAKAALQSATAQFGRAQQSARVGDASAASAKAKIQNYGATFFLHIGNVAARPRAIQLQDVLRSRGFRVAGIETVRQVPREIEVRYFYADDRAFAVAGQSALEEIGFKSSLKYLANWPKPPSPGTVEIWFREGVR